MNETATNTFGKIIEPEPIAYSFNTPGWHIVFAIFVAALVVIGIRQIYIYKKNAYRRKAIKHINSLAATNENSLVFQINYLLKAMAIQLFGREKVASLFGNQWFHFLNSNLPEKVRTAYDFECFSKAIYDNKAGLNESEKESLITFALTWVKYHKVNNV